MSFREKVQKIVIEMAEGKDIKAIKDYLLKSIQVELMENHEKLVMASLEDWKKNTIKAAVYEVLKEMTPEQKKKLFLNDESN